MEKKHIKKNNECLSNDESKALENDLKHFGYLLPTNDEELEEFEKIYGTTKTMFPDHLKAPDFLFGKSKSAKSDKPSSVQANNKENKKAIPGNKKAPVKSIASNSYFRRLVLAAEIASQLHEEPTFGHVKFVKIQYLCEEICNMKLGSNYGKYAAGPLDPKSMYSIDAEFKNRHWFSISKSDYGYKYSPDERIDDYRKYYHNYYSHISSKIDSIINLLKKQKSGFCEIVATMFAVWKDKLSKGEDTSQDSLIDGFYKWSHEKQKFKKEELIRGLDWMNQHDIIPSLD